MNIKNNIKEITICTVCTNDEVLIQKNIELFSKLNKKINIKWVICINKKLKDNKIFADYGSSIKYVEGIEKEHIGSIALHHSIGLNSTLKFIDSRFVIFIDPDFFILRNNFLEDITKYIVSNKLSFIGVPWHPKWNRKYRYFPCSHCLVVDTKNINKEFFDFRPINIVWDKKYSYYNSFINKNKSLISNIFNRILKYNNFLYYNFIDRKNNCFDGDTSHRIFVNLNNSKFKYECFNPCFNIKNDWLIPLNWKINNLIEKILPERYCFFPKNKKSIVFNSKFGDYLSNLSYEGFFWNNDILGFHIRGHPKRMVKVRDKIKEAENVDIIFTKFNEKNYKE